MPGQFAPSGWRPRQTPCHTEEAREMTAPLYLEDLAVGKTFGTGTVAFAAEFDPQPFHPDEDAARASLFGGLVASGWHTAALTMRLLVRGELQVVGGLIGAVGVVACKPVSRMAGLNPVPTAPRQQRPTCTPQATRTTL
jgi:hypothetical protein